VERQAEQRVETAVERPAGKSAEKPAKRRVERRAAGGFTLTEVLVATSLLAAAAMTLAQLIAVGTRANVQSRTTTHAAILAESMLDALRGAPAPAPSPADALQVNRDGYVRHFTADGQAIEGSGVPRDAVYTCRWAIESVGALPGAVIIQVLVIPASQSGVRRSTVTRPSDSVHLVAMHAGGS